MEKLTKAAESNEELKKRVQVLFDKAVYKNMFYQENELKAYLLRLVDKKEVADSNNQMLNQNQNGFQNNRNQNQQQYVKDF